MGKPITYYCDALTAEHAQLIESLDKAKLILVMSDVSCELHLEDAKVQNHGFPINFPYLNAHDKIKLIRGLCDRIEDKLQEVQANE